MRTFQSSIELFLKGAQVITGAAENYFRARACKHDRLHPVYHDKTPGEIPQLEEWCRDCGALRLTVGVRVGPWRIPRYLESAE